ncbi:hypothetical protein [Streptomyces sp. NPDC005760]|uniref:hypothetical protein n=1 Tax=Streptomyces sp. NPDC005760 TaxID=3156718 RepID=UPI0033FEC82D
MSTTLPSPRTSSEVERGDVAEVVALGNALTELFNALEMSQSAYALRVHQDKSTVSRFLRGKKVASQDFIDRLVREVERRRGIPIKPEARTRLDQLRLAAVRETDAAVYELEVLRAEMGRSHREVDRLARQQEALHLLLERREAEFRAVRGELAQIQQDWRDEVALRMRREADADGERSSLAEEVTRLRADLAEATALRGHAERRCEDLERRVRKMEEELAARESDTPGALPLPVLKERLNVLWETGKSQEAGRELTEAAQGRSVEELVELVTWLDERGDSARRNRLAEEVAHTRSVEVVAGFGSALMSVTERRDPRRRRGTPSTLGCVIDGACAVMSPSDLVTLHRAWEQAGPAQGRPDFLRDDVPQKLLNGARSADVAAEFFDLLDPDDESLLRATGRPLPLTGGMLIALVPRMIARGNTELAHRCCRALAVISKRLLEGWRVIPPWGDLALAETDESQSLAFVRTATDVLSADELAYVFMALIEPRIEYSRRQKEDAARFFQLCVADLHLSGRLTEVTAILDGSRFARVKNELAVKLRKTLLAYKP